MEPPTMRRQSFRSLDEYAAALGHADLRVIALGRARARWESCHIDLDGVIVRRARDGGPCVFDGAIDSGVVGLMIGVDAAGKMTGNGTTFGSGSVLVAPPRRHVQTTSLDTVEWISALIPADRLSGTLDLERPPRDLCNGVINHPLTSTQGFHALLTRVAAAAQVGAFRANPSGCRDAADQLVAAARVLLGVPGSPPAAIRRAGGRPRFSRAEVVKHVEQWLDDQADRRPSLRDLARVAGVSERTLHTAFCEQLGVSPKRFLRLRLLNAARRELSRSNPEGRFVTDVVTRLGIWDWGRFSGEYRELFGEMPSETARRRCTGLRRQRE